MGSICKYCGDFVNRSGYCVRCGAKFPVQNDSTGSYRGGYVRPNSNLQNASDDIRKIRQNYKEETARLRQQMKANNNSNTNQGCYVATCVYGSYDCPEVWVLRRFRDYYLYPTWYGRTFIRIYYAISPGLVKCFGHISLFKKMWKYPLDKMVFCLKDKGVTDVPYNDPQY